MKKNCPDCGAEMVDARLFGYPRWMKTPLPCGAVAPMEVVSFGGHKTLTYF